MSRATTEETHIHRSDNVAVLLAEHGHGPEGEGSLFGHLFRAQGRIGVDRLAYPGRDLGKLLFCQGVVVCEVKLEAVLCHERPGLRNVCAQHSPEGGMEEVSCGVVGLDSLTPAPVDNRFHPGPHVKRRIDTFTWLVPHNDGSPSLVWFDGVHDSGHSTILEPNCPRIPNLPTTPWVKRGGIKGNQKV